MLVKVKTNFFGQPEFEIGTPTLRKVILELAKKSQFSLFDSEEGEVQSDFKVYLNGIEFERLPEKMDTELKNGDRVEVNLVILAGG